MSAVTSYARGDMGGVLRSAMGLVKTATGGANAQKAGQVSKATRTSSADVVRSQIECFSEQFFFNLMAYFQISWSGCKDSQTSADTEEAGSATGAMSFVSKIDFYLYI